MRRVWKHLAIAVALVLAGWTWGRAQGSQPDFELLIEAPGGGATTVQCVRGCDLAWVQRGLNLNAQPARTFTFRCSSERCGSGIVGGWTR